MKFSEIYPSLEELNRRKNELNNKVPDLENEEYLALIGRYAQSSILYHSVIQFEAAFLTTLVESLSRLRAKLRINDRLKNMEETEALKDDIRLVNVARNPDTEPSNNIDEALPYVQEQQVVKGSLSPVKGLYNWKHSVGGQAYNEFLDSFKFLFKTLLVEEDTVYEN